MESGHTLADAFSKHPKAFTDLYVNMVAAGEAGGILDTILLRLATFLEKNDALVRKVKGAMVYPGVIFTVAAVAVAVLLIFVIPTFQAMFASVNLELPLPTRIVIGASQLLTNYWWVILARHRWSSIRDPEILRHRRRQEAHRPDAAQRPGPGRPAPEVGRVPLHPDPGHPDQLRREHPGRTRDHGQDGGQPGHPRRSDGFPAVRSPAVRRLRPRSRSPRSSRRW